VHAAACAGIDPALPGVVDQLPRLLRHQQAHGRLAARALSQATGQAVRLPRPTRSRPQACRRRGGAGGRTGRALWRWCCPWALRSAGAGIQWGHGPRRDRHH
jgi:hypothetical protein